MEPRLSIVTLGVQNLERAYHFYHEGLGFPTSGKSTGSSIFFQTRGVCLALYPHDKLAEDVAPKFSQGRSRFPGSTLAHNTRQNQALLIQGMIVRL
ncbi:MAG: VOC family protein [Elainellaceae cyanobacterium]